MDYIKVVLYKCVHNMKKNQNQNEKQKHPSAVN